MVIPVAPKVNERRRRRPESAPRAEARACGLPPQVSPVLQRKVADFRARGVVHFHARMRLDRVLPDEPDAITLPPDCFSLTMLKYAIRSAAADATFTTRSVAVA
jgi:hypothetical protein